MKPRITVFSDIGDTLGIVRVGDAGIVLQPYPFVMPLLAELRDAGVALGIISNTGTSSASEVDTMLRAAGIGDFFDTKLRLYSSVEGIGKESVEIFRRAIARAGATATPAACLYVGEDVGERFRATQAGMVAVPHVLLARDVALGSSQHYIRLSAHDAPSLVSATPGVVALHVPTQASAIAIATSESVTRLERAGAKVEHLGASGAPATTDLFLVRDDRARQAATEAPTKGWAALFAPDAHKILSMVDEGVYIALGADDDIERYHLEDARHGHNLRLLPDPTLTTSRTVAFSSTLRPSFARSWTPEELAALDTISDDAIAAAIARLSGTSQGAVGFASRHVHHPDNSRAVDWVEQELGAIGDGELRVRLHAFTYLGVRLHNVEAELPGTSQEIVLVTAHLDSTARSDGDDYDPRVDPAPGADDDASGVAAILAIARAFLSLPAAARPKRTVRFVLFNAEEQGLIGSQAYARDEAMLRAPIAAVIQMDMVGHRTHVDESTRPCEVHVGAPANPDVEERSLVLAASLEEAVRQKLGRSVTSLQIYRTPDPAAGRSDHASFHDRGYAACVVSEDFFVGPLPSSPDPQANPSYHRVTDTTTIAVYAADIARVVAAAAMLAARP